MELQIEGLARGAPSCRAFEHEQHHFAALHARVSIWDDFPKLAKRPAGIRVIGRNSLGDARLQACELHFGASGKIAGFKLQERST
ncbi:unnamed protein product, partial [Nesidiocoris tenuis]